MGTQDISRSAFDPRKQYASVRMQQGRVIVDEDWNENQRIANEDLRRGRVEVVGPAGSPDDGFRITNPRVTAQDQINFDISAGSFYLGGLRLELHEPQTYLLQKDILQVPGLAGAAPTSERFDLVVLTAYQQPVTAVEDKELFEVALGGPDTTTRLRTMQRVMLHENVGADTCQEAWQGLLKQYAAKGLGSLNDENELVTDATLTVTFTDLGAPDDLCTPTAAGGYLGAENQAIRVELVDANHFTWGFDDAAPLYRVQAAADRQTLTMLTGPPDQAHWPLAEQTVEILPWAAVLPNNEKVAEVRGHLTRVSASYNPDTGELKLADPIPTAGFDDWASRADANALRQGGEYFYMRVWNRGSDRTSPPAIPFTPGTAVPLGQTGLEITLNGTQFRAADYWIIAARPETPHRVVPWELETGRSPHGVRRFLAPLALIHWKFENGTFVGVEVHDCRLHFRPLTRQKICCQFTVGDGKASFGDFDSIEEALHHLPASGGEICLLPGLHETNAVVEGRQNVKITGCDKKTQVTPRQSQGSTAPIFLVKNSENITLQHMDLVTFDGTAIVLEGSDPEALVEIKICYNRILAYQHAIHVSRGRDIRICHNRIRMLDKDGGDVAIYVLGQDALIERNDISVVPAGTAPPEVDVPEVVVVADPADPCFEPEVVYTQPRYYGMYVSYVWTLDMIALYPKDPFNTLGGVQIAGGSERVTIRENTIVGGAGNGITLGSDLDLDELARGAEGLPQETEREIPNRADTLWGGVRSAGGWLSYMKVLFQSEDGTTTTAITDDDGLFLEKVPPGRYKVFIGEPGYQISSIEDIREEFGLFYQINLEQRRVEIDFSDVLAFIYDVSIDGNHISNMGLSGIGIPMVSLEDLTGLQDMKRVITAQPQLMYWLVMVRLFGVLGGFVVDLNIWNNRIERCLQRAFDPDIVAQAPGRGVGGISLGLCDDLVIRENRIENNGTNHLNPVCGIFVLYADQIDISHNQILDNGPELQGTEAELGQGLWGGIVVLFATSFPLAGRLLRAKDASVEFGHAARVHDNVVDQPASRALTMGAFGPVSVTNNRFASASSAAGGLDRFVGAVLIVNLGGLQGVTGVLRATRFAAFRSTSTRSETGGASTRSSSSAAGTRASRDFVFADDVAMAAASPYIAPIAAVQPHPNFPGGNTLFNDNQTRLGAASRSLISQLIVTLDDLGFDGNQSDKVGVASLTGLGPIRVVNTAGLAQQINTVLGGVTLRASDNRFKETFLQRSKEGAVGGPGEGLSLLTVSLLMNNTSHNQGNHCIIAVSIWESVLSGLDLRVSVGNQSLFPPTRACAEIEETIAGQPELSAKVGLLATYLLS